MLTIPIMMTKKQAVKIFGTVKKLAEAIETTTNNFYMFDDPLSRLHTDRIIGAAYRKGLEIPKEIICDDKTTS